MSHWTKQLPEVGSWADRVAFDAEDLQRRIASAEAQIAGMYASLQQLEEDAMSTARRYYSTDEITAAIEANSELINA